MRKSVSTVCLAIMIAFSAQIAAADSDGPHGQKPSDSEKRCLTVKGEFETAILILPPFPSFPPAPFQPFLHLLITANGTLSHFGKTTAATTDQAVDLSVNPNRGTGRWVFQTANGDGLWTETDLSSTPLDAQGATEFWGQLTIIGGSGVFEGATGTLGFEGAAKGNVGLFSITGTICLTSRR